MAQTDEQDPKAVEKKNIEEILATQSKLLEESYDKAMAYTNLVVALGYACFFGLWQITKNSMTTRQMFFSALLMLVSAAVFVLFEVSKMYFVSKQNNDFNQIINDVNITGSLSTIQQAFAEYRRKAKEHHLRWAYWWHYTWIVSVASGVGAVIVLLWIFVTGLLRTFGCVNGCN